MASIHSFVFGAITFLLGYSVLTIAASNTTNSLSPTPSITSTTLSESNSANQTCSTIQCINATVSTNGNATSTVHQSCSVVISCYVIETTSTTSRSAITATTTTARVIATTTTATTTTAATAPLAPSATMTTTTTSTSTTTTAAAAVSHSSSTLETLQTTTGTPPLTSTSSTPPTSSSSAATPNNISSIKSTATSSTTTLTAKPLVSSNTSISPTSTDPGATGTSTTGGSYVSSSVAPSPSPNGAPMTTSYIRLSSSKDSTASASHSTVVPTSSALKPSSNNSAVSKNQSSTVSPTTANTTAYVASSSRVVQPPTSQPKLKSISIKVTFDIPFKEEYRNKKSKAYIKLEKDFTDVLTKTFEKMKGFIRVDIISIREGSVVCDFDAIFNETSGSSPKAEDVKKTLQEASKSGKLGGYSVKNIEVGGEKEDETDKEDLPSWATVTMILLGALGLVLLIIVVILAVLLRRTKESGPLYQVSGEDWAHYETMSMGDYKVRAGEVNRGRLRNGDNNQPAYENHPISHSNLTYQVPANGE